MPAHKRKNGSDAAARVGMNGLRRYTSLDEATDGDHQRSAVTGGSLTYDCAALWAAPSAFLCALARTRVWDHRW